GSVHQFKPAASAVTLEAAVDAYLATLGHAESQGTRRVYAGVLRALAGHFGQDTSPGTPGPAAVAQWFTARWGDASPSRWNVALVALRSADAYWQDQG